MQDRLEAIEKRYEELNQLLASPDILADRERWQSLSREQAAIQEPASKYSRYKSILTELAGIHSMLREKLDREMTDLATQEAEKLQTRSDSLLEELKLALSAKDIDRDSDRNAIMEI